MKFLRDTYPYGHLRTVHEVDDANDGGAYDELTDFRADQHHGNGNAKGKNANHTGGKYEKILAQRQRHAWPVANVESDYECGAGGLNDKSFGAAMTAESTVATLWDIAMAGGYTGYYYTYTAWDVIRPLDVPKGYGYMKNFGGFWRGTKYWQLQPANKLASSGRCLANPGKEYVVYQNKAATFTLEIAGAAAPLAARWYSCEKRELQQRLKTRTLFKCMGSKKSHYQCFDNHYSRGTANHRSGLAAVARFELRWHRQRPRHP